MEFKELVTTEDLVVIRNFKAIWIINEGTKIIIWEILDIWEESILVNSIRCRIMGTLDVFSKNNSYTLDIPSVNNLEAYNYYEKTRSN